MPGTCTRKPRGPSGGASARPPRAEPRTRSASRCAERRASARRTCSAGHGSRSNRMAGTSSWSATRPRTASGRNCAAPSWNSSNRCRTAAGTSWRPCWPTWRARPGSTGTSGPRSPGGGRRREPEAAPARHDALRTMISGLMALRDQTHRTLTVISCLPDTWDYMRANALGPALDRFASVPLANIESAAVGREMIERRFVAEFRRIGFEPEYPSWPIRPGAFDDATNYTPRTLLERVRAHVDACLNQRLVLELDRLGGAPVALYGRASVPQQPPSPVAPPADLTTFDARFRE